MPDSATTENQVRPSRAKRFKRWLLRKVIVLGVIAALLGIAYLCLASSEEYKPYANFFEQTPPSVEVLKLPPGVGVEPGLVRLRVEDTGTGLDELIVRTDQGGEQREVFRKRYAEPKFEDMVEFTVSGKDLDLTEGSFDLLVRAFDRAYWSNGTRKEIQLKVNFERPKLEIVSAQHNAVVGGSELCFYRVSGVEEGTSGVRVGDIEFPGFPARLLDADFEAAPDIYFAYFGIPLQYDRTRDEVRAFARNSVGNVVTAPFYYKVQPVRYRRMQREADELFVETKLHELKEKLEQLDPATQQPDEPAKRFAATVGGLRTITERLIRQATVTPELRSSWEAGGVFQRPPGASLRVDFGEVRDYMHAGELLGSFVYTGAEHVAANNLPVVAAAGGKVRFAGDLGLYGTSVIVDHGFGLSTVYGYLGSTSVALGSEVTAGATLGKAGATGFSDTPALLYEVRVNGIPVRPVEWWDQHWVRDHILHKVEDIKKQLNLVPGGAPAGPETPEME